MEIICINTVNAQTFHVHVAYIYWAASSEFCTYRLCEQRRFSTSSESRGTFRQKTRSLAPLNDWACAVKICHDGMLEDTKSLDAALFV